MKEELMKRLQMIQKQSGLTMSEIMKTYTSHGFREINQLTDTQINYILIDLG